MSEIAMFPPIAGTTTHNFRRPYWGNSVSGLDIPALVKHKTLTYVAFPIEADEFGFSVPLIPAFLGFFLGAISEKLVPVFGVERLDEKGVGVRYEEAQALRFRAILCSVGPRHIWVFGWPDRFEFPRWRELDHIFREHFAPPGNLDVIRATGEVINLKVKQGCFASDVDAAIRPDSYNP